MSIKLSIVLPVYNGGSTVISSIESIQTQTWQDWELIILDDGSQDDSYEVCLAAADQDTRIRLYRHSRNKGLAYAMNGLVSLASGKYIAVQEQDDLSLPKRMEKEIEILESKPEIGLVSGIAEWIDGRGNILAYFPGLLTRGEQFPQDKFEMVRFLYTEQSKIVNAACMFRRSVINENDKPFDEQARISIDWQFFLHLAHKHLVWGIPEVLVRMRRGSSHQHLTSKKDLQFSEARRCIQLVYKKYRHDLSSPINRGLYHKAMATELLIEGRSRGGIKGLFLLLQGLSYAPADQRIWKSIDESRKRGMLKLLPGHSDYRL